MKRVVVLFTLLTLLSTLLSCGQRETTASAPAEPAAATAAAKPFRVGLLTPGSINDGGWNALAWEGMQRIQREIGAEISHQETKTPAEMTEGFRAFGRSGFDLAFGHGFEYQEPAKAAGAAVPEHHLRHHVRQHHRPERRPDALPDSKRPLTSSA